MKNRIGRQTGRVTDGQKIDLFLFAETTASANLCYLPKAPFDVALPAVSNGL
jgi:hypothetical protein